VAVAVAWRVEMHSVTRRSEKDVHFWFDQSVEAGKRGSEQIASLSSHYRVQLDSMKAAIEKLAEENVALNKELKRERQADTVTTKP